MTRLHLKAAGILAVGGAVAAATVVVLGHSTHRNHATAPAKSKQGRLAAAAEAAPGNPKVATSDGDAATISAPEAAQMGFEAASIHQRGRFTGASGRAFGLYTGRRSDTSKRCVILASAGSTGAACDSSLFRNGPVSFVETFSGGPAKTQRTDLEIAGIVADNVARLDVVDSLDRVTDINTRGANKSFFFQLEPGELARGVDVNTLIARDATGAAIASFDVSQQAP
jgi:hypothetical protein